MPPLAEPDGHGHEPEIATQEPDVDIGFDIDGARRVWRIWRLGGQFLNNSVCDSDEPASAASDAQGGYTHGQRILVSEIVTDVSGMTIASVIAKVQDLSVNTNSTVRAGSARLNTQRPEISGLAAV